MKLKEGLVIREVGGKKVAVATGELAASFRGMITIGNPTAELLWDGLREDTTVDALTALVADRYGSEADLPRIKADVEAYVAKLQAAGLLI